MYLTDEPNNPTKWMILDNSPGMKTIAAGRYLLIWVDPDEQDFDLHVCFSLDAENDDIFLYDRDGQTIID